MPAFPFFSFFFFSFFFFFLGLTSAIGRADVSSEDGYGRVGARVTGQGSRVTGWARGAGTKKHVGSFTGV